MTSERRDLVYTGLIVLLWIAAILLVDPRGDFPTVDDWAYARSVSIFRDARDIGFSDWTATNLLTNIVWGALFGTSFEMLRASTLVAALLGGVVFYRLMRAADASPEIAVLSALILLFNPLAFALSFSFMTDVPYTTLQVGAMWLIVSGIVAASRRRVLLGWALGAGALLSRQTALSLPLGLGGEGLLRRHPVWRRVLVAAIVTIVYLAIQIAYTHWLRASGRAPALLGRQMDGMAGRLFTQPLWIAKSAAKTTVHSLLYIGLFLLPVTIIAFGALVRRLDGWPRRAALASVAAVAAVLFAYMIRKYSPFPTWQNTLLDNGLTTDARSVRAPYAFLVAVAVAAAFGAGLLFTLLADAVIRMARPRDRAFDAGVFGLMTGLALLGSMIVVAMKFDRYFIPVVPCFLLAVAPAARRFTPGRLDLAVATAALLAMGLGSVCAGHDLMAAKRTKWAAYRELTRTVPARFVDAGWVFNGPANYGRYGPRDYTWNWFERDDYRIETIPETPGGFRTIGVRPVDRWLPWGRGQAPVLIQRKLP